MSDMETTQGALINNEGTFRSLIQGVRRATVKFIKKDGAVRIMNFTLDFGHIPDSKHPKGTGKVKTSISVYDIDKAGWRTIPYERVQWLKVHQGPNKPQIMHMKK